MDENEEFFIMIYVLFSLDGHFLVNTKVKKTNIGIWELAPLSRVQTVPWPLRENKIISFCFENINHIFQIFPYLYDSCSSNISSWRSDLKEI